MSMRARRRIAVGLGLVLLAGCAPEGPTAGGEGQVPLVVRATVVAQTLAGRRIDIDVGYRRTTGERIALEVTPASIPVEGGTRQVPVTVTIESCLRDAQRAPAGQAGCALDILLRLRTEGGAVEDSVRIIPTEAAVPGATLSPPSAQLFGSYGLSVRGVTGAAGNGAIISEPAGISCAIAGATASGQCSASFSGRSPVRVIATAAPGSDFTGWGAGSGCPAGPAPCVLTLTGAATLTPSFSQRRVALGVSVGGPGRGTVAVTTAEAASSFVCVTGASVQSCTRDLLLGATAQLAAQPDAGNRFLGWGGACTGTGACSVTMSAAQSVLANFAVDSAALTVTVTGGVGVVRSQPAGIDCAGSTGTCSARFPVGSSVSLSAEPAPNGFRFVGWTGACSGNGACAVTMNGAQSVGATFAALTVPVTVTVTGDVGIVQSTPSGILCGVNSVNCTAAFALGSTLELQAIPVRGQGRFVRWSGACANQTDAICRVTVTGALTVGAQFERVAVITVENPGTGAGRVTERVTATSCTFPGGSTSCTVTESVGTVLTFTAIPDANARFAGWGGVGAACGTTSLTCAVTVSTAGTLTATFERIVPTLVLTPRTLTFVDTIGRPPAAARTVALTSVNGTIAALSVLRVENTPNVTFLSVGTLAGATPQSLQIGPAPGALTAGSYSARVLISAPGASNSVDTITVTRTVVAPPLAVWRVEANSGSGDTLRAVSGRSATDQMAVGVRAGGTLFRAVRFNGANWATVDEPLQGLPRADGIIAVPGGPYIAATQLQMRRYVSGTNWVREGDPPNFQDAFLAIHALGITGVMAVGGGSTPVSNRFDGAQWRRFTIPTGDGAMRGVWSFSQTSAIAVGDFGSWARFDFGIWTFGFLPSSINPQMRGVWAASPTFAVAVGEAGSIFRYDGTAWTQMAANTTVNLSAVFGTSPTNIIAVGDGGLILRYDGTSWRPMTSPVTTALYGVWMADDNNAVAVGANGVILRYAAP